MVCWEVVLDPLGPKLMPDPGGNPPGALRQPVGGEAKGHTGEVVLEPLGP